jgi:hypothetical protein
MATFRKKRSRKYKRRNTRRKSHIKRRGKKSLVGGTLITFIKNRLGFSKNVPSSTTSESSRVIQPRAINTMTLEGTSDMYIQDMDTEDILDMKKIEQLLTAIDTAIQANLTKLIDNGPNDTTSLEDVVLNIKRTYAELKTRYIEAVSTISIQNSRLEVVFKERFTKLANETYYALIMNLDNIVADISKSEDQAMANKDAKKKAILIANAYYESLKHHTSITLIYSISP